MFDDAIRRWSACVGLSGTEKCGLELGDAGIILGCCLLAGVAILFLQRFARTLLTLRAKSFTPPFARFLSKWVKTNDYTGQDFFRADGADGPTVTRRQQAL